MKTTRNPRSKSSALPGLLAPLRTDWSGDESGQWWLFTAWGPQHRNSIEDIHPLLVQIGEAKGPLYLTSELVVRMLDARDPQKTAAQIMGSPLSHEIVDDHRMSDAAAQGMAEQMGEEMF